MFTAALSVNFLAVDEPWWPFISEATHRQIRCHAYRDDARRPTFARGPAGRAPGPRRFVCDAAESARRHGDLLRPLVALPDAAAESDDSSVCSDALM